MTGETSKWLKPDIAVKRALLVFSEFQERGSYEAVFVEGVERAEECPAWDVTVSYTLRGVGDGPAVSGISLPGPRLRSVVTIDDAGNFVGMFTRGRRS